MSKTVRAKFLCVFAGKSIAWGGAKGNFQADYKFNAVTSGSEENKEFFQHTPSGSIELHAVHFGLFEVGQEYYLDFTPAPMPQPAADQ